MTLSPTSCSWLRSAIVATTAELANDTTIHDRLLACAEATPAWVEPYETVAQRLAAAEVEGSIATLAALAALRLATPQVIGIDAPGTILTTAEWRAGNLLLRLDVASEDPDRMSMFQIVGAEPRVWDLTGINGTRMEFTMRAVIVRHPSVSGLLEFVAGSY
ncbi:MAG: hypothetical protein R2706_08160 [Acidimicrobiales bacterium]